MAYIDIDKFAESICNFQAIDEDAANKMIWLLRTFPIADVVPKSEVAREIFEEIETLGLVGGGLILTIDEYSELKKKYTEDK